MRRLVCWLAAAVCCGAAWMSPGFFKSSCASAAVVYWDTNGTLAGCGTSASGNWPSTSWNSDLTGGSGTISIWSAGNDAVLSAGTDAVGSFTISVTGAPIIRHLAVEEGNVTLVGTGSLALSTSASSASWLVNAGASLVVQPNVAAAIPFVVGGGGSSTFAGVISGVGNLSKTDSGTVTLQAANTFLGTTSIGGGTLKLAHSAALQLSTLVTSSTGSLAFDPSVTSHQFVLGNLSGTGGLSLQTSGGTPVAITLTVGGNNTSAIFSGVLGGSGALVKTGFGTLTLTGSNTFTGGTTIGNGAIQLGDGTSGHDGVLPAVGGILNNASLVYNLFGPQAFSGAISGSGGLSKSGTGTLVLTGTSSFSGGTTISAGTLQLGDGTAGHDGMLSGTGGIVNNAALVANLSAPQTFASPVSGVGTLVKLGASILTLTQPNSFTGGTTISAGTLQLGDGTSGHDGLLADAGGVANNALLAFNLSGPQVYAGNITGSGAVVKAGTGTLTLGGSNTFTGGTTVGAGVLSVANTANLPGASTTGKVTLGSGATLALSVGGTGYWSAADVGNLFSANGSGFASGSTVGLDTAAATGGFVYSSSITGSFALAKLGPGLLTLTGSSTYGAGTVVSGGSLQLGNGTASSGYVAGGITNNAALIFTPFAPQTFEGAISGAGTLVKSGSSILTLAGSDTFSGATTVSGGTLVLAHCAALQGSTLVAPPAGSLVFDSSVSSHAFNLGGLSGTGSIALLDTAATPVALSAGGNNATTVYTGILSGSGSLIKIGTGTLTLTASQTFGGGTTISAGVLQLGDGLAGHNGWLATAGSITNNATLSFNLNGSQTFAGTIGGSGNVLLASGSLTAAPGSSIATSGSNLHVGEFTGATLTVPGGSWVNVGGELDVNYQATSSGMTGVLNLQGGTLNVGGPAIIGRARVGGSGTSAVVNLTGGSMAVGGRMTIGQNGTSIYNASGGTLKASSGLIVGGQGNGVLNISAAGCVSVSGSAGLAIGSDPLGASGGTVNLSGGSLTVLGKLVLGNSGMGTLVYSGGVLTGSGNLVASGAGTLVLANSVAAYFGGKPMHTGNGTLVVVPQTGGETLTFKLQPTPPPANGILGPWAVQQTSGSLTSGDYLALTGSSLAWQATVAPYDDFAAGSENWSTPIISVTGAQTLDYDGASPYVVKFTSGASLTLNQSLYVTGGGMILNGSTILSGGTGGSIYFSPEGSLGSVTGMVFAGSDTASTIGVPLCAHNGLVKFGPGTLVLASNNPIAGGVVVSAGVLNVQKSYALGSGGTGNDLLVASGAALEIEGGTAAVELPAVAVSVGGTGIAGAGALRNISGNNSLSGVVALTSDLQIATDSGSLALLAPLQGNHNLTKTGTGTLSLSGDSSGRFTGSISVPQGVLDVSNSGALGTPGGGAMVTIGSGASLSIHGGIDVAAVPITLGGTGLGGQGVLRNTQGDNSLSGPLNFSLPSQISVDAGSLSLYGVVSGGSACALAKTGSGMLVLGGVNTFSGSLSATAGTLSVWSMGNTGVAGPLGVAGSPVGLGTSGGTTTFDYAGYGDVSNRPFALAGSSTTVFQVDYPWATLALNGAITGSGSSFVKTGYGMLTLGNTASYSGSTRIAQGVLGLDPGGALTNTSSVTVCPGAMLQLTNSGASNQVPDSASISLQGSVLAFYGNGSSSSNGEIVGSLLLGGADNTVSVSCTSGTNQPYLRFASFPTPASHTVGTTVSFSASGARVQFSSSSSASFTNGILGGYTYYNSADFAALSGSGGPFTVQACANSTTGDLALMDSSGTANARPTGLQTSLSTAKTFYSLNLAGAAGIQMTGSGSLTLLSGGLIANTSGNVRSGVLKGSASGELTINAVQDIAISSTIADSGGPTALVKTGPATLTLSGTNTYTGDTFLNQGLILYYPPANTTYGGSIHGLGGLTKSGTATLTLTGTGDFSGTTTVTGGGLCVNGILGASSTVNLQSSGFLAGSGTIGGDVTATGGGIALAPGGNILGSVTVTSGTLTVGKAGLGDYLSTSDGLYITGAGALAAASTAATIVGNVTYASSANTSFPCMMSGSGSVLTLAPPDTSTFTLTNTASMSFGGVALDSGTLKISSTAALGDNALSINGGTLDLGGWSQFTINSLAGSGGVIASSSGTTDLVLHSSSGTMNFGGSIAGAGFSLTKSGPGTLVLSGSNTFAGGVTVSDGVLGIGSGAALADGNAITVEAGGAILFDGGLATAAGSAAASPALAESLPLLVPAPVPEPGTWALLVVLGVGLGLLAIPRKIGA